MKGGVGVTMKDMYYIVLTIGAILTFYLKLYKSKMHPTTGNSKMHFKVEINLQWLKLIYESFK